MSAHPHGWIAEYRYVQEHLRRAIREHGDAPIRASTVAERAADNIARGRRYSDASIETLRDMAADMLRRRCWRRA